MTLTESAELLIVEDNPNDLELTLRALKKNRVSNAILTLKDGAEALDYLFCLGRYASCTAPLPKVIFLDLKLPKVDGMEVLRQIRSHDRTRTIPVVMLTSSQQDRDVAESYRLGVNSYIVKPVDFSKFATAITQLGSYWLSLNYPNR
jgi:two-component system response regulator